MYDPDTQAPPAPKVTRNSGRNQHNTGSLIAGSAATTRGKTTSGPSGGARPGEGRPSMVASVINQKPRQGDRAGIGKNRLQKIQNKAFRSGTPWKPTPRFVEQPDPRDSMYWANRMALETTLGTNLAYLQHEQDRSDTSYAENTELQNEYMRRRVRDMAESRLGTGSIYSGSHVRAQRENKYDFMADERRRALDKQASDNELDYEQNSLMNEYNASLQQEELAGAGRAMEQYAQESEEARGDAAATKPKYGRKIKDTNKRIKLIRGRMEEASTEGERRRWQKQYRNLQKRRAVLKGKARRDRG